MATPTARDVISMLATLRWQETSGVDHPANEEEGWVVLKAAGDIPVDAYPEDGLEKVAVKAHTPAKEKTASWSAAAAEKRWRKWASSDGSGDEDKINWKKYESGFAVADPDKRGTLGAYGFLHHDIVDDKPVLVSAGMLAAGNAASGARTGTANKDAQTHLGPHYGQFDRDPPWKKAKHPTKKGADVMALTDEELEQVLEQMVKEEAAVTKDHYMLLRALEGLQNYLGEAPDEIQKPVKAAITALNEFLVSKVAKVSDEDVEDEDEPPAASDVSRGQIARFAMQLLRRLTRKATDEKNLEKQLEPLGKAWPAFCEKTAAVLGSEGTPEAKLAAFDKVVAELRDAVTNGG